MEEISEAIILIGEALGVLTSWPFNKTVQADRMATDHFS
jgi:hypothetical protein